MKKSTCFNIGLIELAIKGKYLKALAFYYLIKAKFSHAIIYNYTPNKLAKLSGLHHQTVNRYVSKLLKVGLAIERDGHLLFVKSSKVVKGKLIILPTRPYTSFEGILDRLHYTILINNKAKQTYKTAFWHEQTYRQLNPKVQRKIVRQASKTNIEQVGLESTKPVLTVRNASKMFNVSQRTAANIINNLKKKNYIKLRPYIQRIGKIKKSSFLDGSYFNSNGYLFRYIGRILTNGSYLTI